MLTILGSHRLHAAGGTNCIYSDFPLHQRILGQSSCHGQPQTDWFLQRASGERHLIRILRVYLNNTQESTYAVFQLFSIYHFAKLSGSLGFSLGSLMQYSCHTILFRSNWTTPGYTVWFDRSGLVKLYLWIVWEPSHNARMPSPCWA